MRAIALRDVEVIGAGLRGPEGIAVHRDGSLYGGGNDGVIRRVAADGTVTDFARTGGLPLGLAFDRDGDLFVCDAGLPGVARVTPDGRVSRFAERVGEDRLSFPNFCVFGAEGNLYVSNSTTRPLAEIGEALARPEPTGAVYCLRPDGSGFRVAAGLCFANGLAIDPEESALWVLESTRADLLRIPILGSDRHGAPEVFCRDLPAAPDGMAFDAEGNLVVTLVRQLRAGAPAAEGNQLVVVDRRGEVTTLVHDPEGATLRLPSNCAFCGPELTDLCIASLESEYFCRVRYGTRGHPLYHQR